MSLLEQPMGSDATQGMRRRDLRGTTEQGASDVVVEYVGELYPLDPSQEFYVGRDADLSVDDNPYLHRRFLRIARSEDLWWLENVGTQMSATVSDSSGTVQAWLAPGARLPLVFGIMTVIFTAGPITYELLIRTAATPFHAISPEEGDGEATIGPARLTPSQRLLILALAEPMLRQPGLSASEIPSSAQAAERLGWVQTRFNRKLDNVCDKLAQLGVQGLRGGPGKLATNRRARLVEYAVSSRLVTADDLRMLDEPEHA